MGAARNDAYVHCCWSGLRGVVIRVGADVRYIVTNPAFAV